MTLLQLLLSSSLIFLNILTTFESNLTLDGLPDYIVPNHYNIFLFQEKNSFNGTCHIFITIEHPTRNIGFHAQKPHLEIKDYVLTKINSSNFYTPKNSTYYNENHIFDLIFADELIPGHYILRLIFITYLDSDGKGLFKTSYTNEGYILTTKWLIFTYSHGKMARRIFPCWDKPTFLATFNISIFHHNKYTALSNMPVRHIINSSDDMMWTHFYETPLMPTYLITIMIHKYSNTHLTNNIKIWYRNQLKLHLKFAKMFLENVKLHMESHYKYCMEFAKIDHAAIPSLLFDSIQNPGLIFYRETALIYEEELDPVAHKIDVARLIGREVAHQCFNNFGNPFWWSTSWFNEGTAMLFAADAINKTYSQNISYLLVVQIQQESLRLDTESIMKPLSSAASEIYSLSPFSYYIKAPAVLRMVQHMLTAEVFWNGIEMYLKNIFHERKEEISTAIYDLWNNMIYALYDSNRSHRFSISTVMNPWIEINHYPIIKVEHHNADLKIFIENKHALNQEMRIYVTTQTYSYADNTSIYRDLWLPSFSCNETYKILSWHFVDWIIINVQQVGYYRVNYDFSYWNAIIHYLRTYPNNMEIHVLNRAQIIDDAFYFLMNNQLPLNTFLELTKYLQQETYYVVWYPMIKALEHMSGFFLFDDSINIMVHMRNILHELLENIGYTENFNDNDLIKCLRQEAAKWACILGDSDCKSNAIFKLKQHLYYNTTEKILPWWKKWTYCNGLIDNNMWLQTFNEWKYILNNTLSEYLSCSESPYIIIDYLNAMQVDNDETIKCNLKDLDCQNVEMEDDAISFLFIVAKHAKNDIVFEHILNKFEKIKPRKISTYVALIIIINHVYYKEQLDKVNEIVGKLMNLPTIDITSLVKQKIYKRLSEIKNQMSYFQNLIQDHWK